MRDLFYKFLRYIVTGGVAAVVDAGGFFLLTQTKLPIAPAGILSFCVAALVNYRLTGRFVFNQGATAGGFALFLFAALIGLTVNVGVMLASLALFDIWPLAAKILGIGTAFLVNFCLNVRFVFRTDV
jgi:putative flippase GtrA